MMNGKNSPSRNKYTPLNNQGVLKEQGYTYPNLAEPSYYSDYTQVESGYWVRNENVDATDATSESESNS